jgi:putative DNA primase/helicase
MTLDCLHLLHSVSRKHAAKQFSIGKDGTIKNRSYGSEEFFKIECVPLAGFNDLAGALTRLTSQPFTFVVRGEPLPGVNWKHARRLLHRRSKTGDEPTFKPAARHWVPIDLDHIPTPALCDPINDPLDAIEYLIGLLPPELTDAQCWWQFTSSQSLPGHEAALSARLWYWAEPAHSDEELTRWALAVNRAVGFKLIDSSLFRAVQPNYVAAPLFSGMTDPLPRRWGVRQGLEETVRLVIPPPDPKRPDMPSAQGYEPGRGVEAYLAEIGGPRGFRSPIVSAIASYVASYGSAADPEPIKRAIRDALDLAEPGGRSVTELERYTSDKHLDEIFVWIRNVHGDRPPKEFIADPPPHVIDPEIPLTAEETAVTLPVSEDALALEFSVRHAALRYVALWGRWLQWDGGPWKFEDTLAAFDLARHVAREAANAQGSTSLAKASVVAAIERLARADRRHAATTEQWDCNPAAFLAATMTVNLTTGENYPPRKEDYITKTAAVMPNRACPIPLWRAFLERVTAGDVELQRYLQRVAGYCMTGHTREHVLFFFFGPGANGKGVFLNTLSAVWGDYAAVAAMETFIETKNEQHPTDLAMLRGARLVVAQEVDKGKAWAQSKITRLSGGDPITARFMRQDFFTFTPQFKLIIAGNNKPSLRTVDEAIRRRFHLVPFTVIIPAAERDLHLFDKLKPEWPGILQWAVDGCLDWQKIGLAPPPLVTNATEKYLSEEDAVGNWIDECCAVDPAYAQRKSELYESWKRRAENAGEHPGTQKAFSLELEKRGFKTAREGGTGMRLFRGIGLKHFEPPPPGRLPYEC